MLTSSGSKLLVFSTISVSAYSADRSPRDNRTNWGRMLLQAADRKEPGTVALLVSVGLQRTGWGGLNSAMFATMIRALHDVGLDGEARLIAAEAMRRL